MYVRAAAAKEAGACWTGNLEVAYAGAHDPTSGYQHLWVALTVGRAAGSELVGIIAARTCDTVGPELAGVDGALDWPRRGDVAELHHLRVSPRHWRSGIGRRLVETVTDWASQQGYRMLVLNTTAPQWPARRLYESEGFRELGLSYLDRYELVWYGKSLRQ